MKVCVTAKLLYCKHTNFMKDVVFVVFLVNCPSTNFYPQNILLAKILNGEQDTVEWLIYLTLARDDGMF